jgi:hypothetical protein
MAKKVELDAVKKALETTDGIEVRPRNEVIQKLREKLQQEELEEEMGPPAIKKEFVILLSDPKGRLSSIDDATRKQLTEIWGELVGWVLQIPEGESPATLLDKVNCCAAEHNASPKGRKFTLETVGEAMESLSPKITKEYNLWIKTKLPVQVITTDNRLSQNAKAGYVDEADEARVEKLSGGLMAKATEFKNFLKENGASLSVNGKTVVDFTNTNPPTE